ncbi:MAG TPA: hypothetical protein VNL35_00920, partial [Chloroflexota bacterium]|nr:hypothetical protein [Chloroflexota bacterium]
MNMVHTSTLISVHATTTRVAAQATITPVHVTATKAVALATATRTAVHGATSRGINITVDANTILAVATVALALSTIALVYVTWSNARKTQHLVDETREAREMGVMPVITCELVCQQL